MSGNTSPTFIDLGLKSASDYWNEIVLPNICAYFGNANILTTLNASQALWHFLEWAWHESIPTEFSSFQSSSIFACPQLQQLRDVAEAGKHRGLNRPNLDVTQAEAQQLSRGMAESGGSPLPVIILTMSDGSKVDMANVLQAVTKYWVSALPKLGLRDPLS